MSEAPAVTALQAGAVPLWEDVVAAKYQPSTTAWLMTFVDLTGLMVVFFVLLFSKQTLESEKWDVISGSFRAKFAPREAVVQDVVDGMNNAEIRRVPVRSGLGYLDALMQQHLEKSVVWNQLRGRESTGNAGREMVYDIPPTRWDVALAKADWEELGAALRGWKNPVGVRVSAGADELEDAARRARRLALVLGGSGVVDAFAEVQVGEPAVQLIVRAR